MADQIRKPGMKRYGYQIGIGVAAAAIIAALIWRIQCCILYYDEALNAYISYLTAVMGQRHLVENGYIFSMGDLFNLPFVYLFCKATGGTQGIILFMRFVYLGFNIALAAVLWKVFGSFVGKRTMLLFGLILITFFPGGMYTVYYDTSAFFFALMGGSLLLGSELRENKKTGIYRYFAGVCHACMTYAYPLMAGVVLILLIGMTIFHLRSGRMKGKGLLGYWLPYLFGGMTVFGIFLLYVFCVGWQNVFIFQPGFFQNSLGGREIGEIVTMTQAAPEPAGSTGVPTVPVPDPGAVDTAVTAKAGFWDSMTASPFFAVVKRILSQVYQLLNYMWIQQKMTLGFTLVMLAQWGVGLARKGKWRLLLIPEIILVGFFTHTKMVFYGGSTMYAYCFCWTPFLLCYFEKEERKKGVILFLVLGLTSIASFFAMGFTSVRLDIAHLGLYCGGICAFLFMILLVKRMQPAGMPLSAALIILIALCNTGMAYIDHFQGADIKDCTYRMQKGIYKGMMTWEKDIQYEHLKECLDEAELPKGATFCMTDYDYYGAGLEADLLSTRGNASMKEKFDLRSAEQLLQEGMEAEAVYEQLYWPDVVIVDKENEESYANARQTVLTKHYELALDEQDYYLYLKEQ